MGGLGGWRQCVLLAGVLFASHFAQAEEITISGSGNPEYVLQKLAEQFTKTHSAHRIAIPASSGTAGAIRDVLSGAVVLGRVGRPLKPDELAKGLVFVPIGRDPVAFVAGAGTTAKGLTSAQVLDVYSGKTTNWSALGAKPAPIRAIGRETSDASRQAIFRINKPFEAIQFGENVKVVHLDPQMIELLDRYPSSLGFLNRSALSACKTKVVFLSVDGVEPSPQNVGVGRYPYLLEFGLIHKPGALTPGTRAFIDFIRSSEGIRILRENGVLAAASPA